MTDIIVYDKQTGVQMSETPTEASPDQDFPIELRMLIICDSCGKKMGTGTANWTQSGIDRKITVDPDWDRVVISHGTCDDCLAKAKKENQQYFK